ncbi:YciI family protein [Kordiimonas lipolytica]|uniref:YciI family protein n=1 Tax=Kordiimonas lipolytica TaxID=1662421 RepID=A0ABV8U6S5_9PROT|nr:YciI family protein [Kordiimonas lipolytica]
MLFMILAHDKPDSVDLRMANRPAHLDYIKGAGNRIKVAGPILSPGDDPKPVGSMIIIDAASEGAVRLFAENDPYATAGLFEAVEIKPWKAVAGDWIPA